MQINGMAHATCRGEEPPMRVSLRFAAVLMLLSLLLMLLSRLASTPSRCHQ
jgi:hypothetical protein